MKHLLGLLAALLLGLALGGCVTTTTTTYGPPGQTFSAPPVKAEAAQRAALAA